MSSVVSMVGNGTSSVELEREEWSRANGLIPGGEASHQWLCDHGYRTASGDLNARAAWEFVESKLGLTWNFRDHPRAPRRRRYLSSPLYPHILGPQGEPMQPSLADLVRHARNEITLNFVTWKDSHERALLPLMTQGRPGKQFSEFIRAYAHKPSRGPVLFSLAQWLAQASAGEPSTFLFFICPDWATKDGKYTFSSLGSGIGLVARRALEILPVLYRWAEQVGIKEYRVQCSIGDFEGDSQETCRRLGIDADEFRRRCRASLTTFSQELARRCPPLASKMDYSFATDLAGGTQEWEDLVEAAEERLSEGLETALHQAPVAVESMVRARFSLYERWYGDGVDARAVLTSQLREYGAMGAIAQSFPNPLVIGVDHVAMAAGFQVLAPEENALAVLYLRHDNY